MVTTENELWKLKLSEIEKCISVYEGNDISLYSGATGFSLFYFNLYRSTNETIYLEKCHKWIEFVIDQLQNQDIGYTFCNGCAGVGWTLDFLKQKEILEFDIDFLENMDGYIYGAALDGLSKGKYDFLHGGGGAILYAIRRLPHPKAATFLTQAVGLLNETKLIDPYGIKWKDTFSKKDLSQDTYNLGLAHGAPSIVNLLLRIHKKGIAQKETYKLIESNLQWVLSCKIKAPNSVSLYPNSVYEKADTPIESSRLAWCYGDLGIAWALWHTGSYFKNEIWRNEALSILRLAVNRTQDTRRPNLDAGFCHGTSGIAYFFKRFYQETNIEECNNKYLLWVKETLSQARFANGHAGYLFYHPQSEEKWINRYGLLSGICGTGMVLMDPRVDPDWDECFLLSI